MVMGIAGIPRVYRGNGVEHGGNTAGMELGVTVLPRNWGQPLRSFSIADNTVSKWLAPWTLCGWTVVLSRTAVD